MKIPEMMARLHESLDTGGVPHAFGGALALGWCTAQARGTVDIDLNLFVPAEDSGAVLALLPNGVRWDADDVAVLERDGQTRLWWDETPVDLFFNTTPFHEAVATRTRREPFEGVVLPFLSCRDLAVFKAFCNRTKDWADIEAMLEVDSLDVDAVLGLLTRYLGTEDERVVRLLGLVQVPSDRPRP